MQVRRRIRLASSITRLAVLAALVTSSAARADDVADFYRKTNITIGVGSGPGGGYDAYARLIAPYLGRELGASVVVENQPGAGGIVALNNLAIAPPDGLHIMLVNGWSSGLSQIMGAPGVRFDLDRLTQLGTVSLSPSLWLVPRHSPFRSIADARSSAKPINWSGMSVDDGLFVGARVVCEALRLKCNVVMGYKGTNEAGLAVARGETDSVYLSDTSANEYVKIGDVRAMANISRARSRFFPDLPSVFEIEKLTPEAEWLLDFQATFENLGRIVVMPANVAPARLAFVNAAIERTLRNPALIADGEKTQRYIDFVDAETTRKSVRAAIGALTGEQKARFKAVIAASP